MTGARLVVVATPIGNLDDLTYRAASKLKEAELWIVEDTRQSAKLQAKLGVRKPMRVLSEHTTSAEFERLMREFTEGRTIALVTDAGCPSISDPGAQLIDRCHEAGVEVDAVPGPSSVTTALMLSGFYAQRFVFLGFLPRKPGDILKELRRFSDATETLVLFESPLRADKTLGLAFEALGDRRYAICREMTKAHQQVYRDRLPRVPDENRVPRKGEWTLVVEGKRRRQSA